MSLIEIFQFCLNTKQAEVYKFLHYLDDYAHVGPENKSLEVQRVYAIRWCVLSQFLYENRHHNFKIPSDKPLKFIVHFTASVPCSTSVHWYQSFYQVDLLSKQLVQSITLKTGIPALGSKVKSGLITLTDEEEVKSCKSFVIFILQVIALLHLCLHIIDTACVSFQDQPVVNVFKLRLKWLTVVCVWLRATLLNRITDDESLLLEGFRMLQGCILLLAAEPTLLQDEFVGALEKNLRIQMYLAGAKYYTEDGKHGKAGFCYSKAQIQGWKPDETALLMMEDQEEIELELDQHQQQQQQLQPKKPEDLIKPIYFTGKCKELTDSIPLQVSPCKQEQQNKL